MESFGSLGVGSDMSPESFDQVFNVFDRDGNGTIDKQEMVYFVKTLLGL